ncbi:uncharacterized protein [Parasteatoda tepidariorum]|uniref:uncharacterized protein n=1 Tax=Parasteatoda tepidariorum TaxID=114398 RepID=UPI0039BD15BD
MLLILNEKNVNSLVISENIEDDVIEKEASLSDEYSYKFKKMNLLFNRKVNLSTDIDTQSAISGNIRRKFKLPRLELKKFDGEIKDCLPFWGQFRKIDEDADIDETDKFQCLVQATIQNSRARELVESLPPSSGNYAKVIDCLKSRFGRDDFLVEYYVRELLKVTFSFNSEDKQIKLSTIYDHIETHLRSLETLETTEKYAAMLFPLVESCLSEEILRAWQRNEKGLKKSSKEESRLESLMNFLKNEVENSDRIALAMQGFSLKENTKYSKVKRDIPTAEGLFSGNRSFNSKCVFWGRENHEANDSHFARNMDLNEKTTKLKKHGCCFKCLNIGHLSKLCRVRINCENCKMPVSALME